MTRDWHDVRRISERERELESERDETRRICERVESAVMVARARYGGNVRTADVVEVLGDQDALDSSSALAWIVLWSLEGASARDAAALWRPARAA